MSISPELVRLRQEYGAHLRPGNTGKQYLRYVPIMEQLLGEWDPVGHTVEEVRFVLGPPVQELQGDLAYSFEDGWAGRGWRFRVKDGRIVAVENLVVN